MQKLPKNRVVLLGVGHTNAHVAKMWKMNPIPRTELLCISDSLIASYSGMVPGVLAGAYPQEKMNIDLVRFCQSVGAMLVTERVQRINTAEQLIEFEQRPPLSYDLLSIGIGSRPDKSPISDSSGRVVPIKPMQTLMTRLETAAGELIQSGLKSPRIAIVGGGIGGVEIAFCLPNFLQKRGITEFQISIVNSSDSFADGVHRSVDKKIRSAFEEKKICPVKGRVLKVEDNQLHLSDDSRVDFDLCLWATSAVAPDLLQQIDLPKDSKGFLLTRPTLQSTGNDAVFVVGDSGTLKQTPTPKAGVFAVRQGPVLWKNIQRYFSNQPLSEYKPQHDFLKLINTGDGKAIAAYRGFAFRTKWAWNLKDRIDSQFIEKYQDYKPSMGAMDSSESEPEMRCLGCGGKIGGSILSRVLGKLQVRQSDRVLIGLDQPDDCAVIRTETNSIAVTTDFFASPVPDPYLAGRIGALNSLSDVFVMGAQPTAALAIITVPYGRQQNQEELLYHVLSGSLRELDAAGASLVGGHTIEGHQLTIGFTILAEPQSEQSRFTKGELKPGDRLILSKPIGSGAILAAHMQAECHHATYQSLVDTMTTSNLLAARIATSQGIEAMTDVTGFGLAGHLIEMLKASQLQAYLEIDRIPLICGAADLFEKGIESTLAPANRDAEIQLAVTEAQRKHPAYNGLFDPQTCGGVLLGVSESQVEKVLTELKNSGHHQAAEIGVVLPNSSERKLITIQ